MTFKFGFSFLQFIIEQSLRKMFWSMGARLREGGGE